MLAIIEWKLWKLSLLFHGSNKIKKFSSLLGLHHVICIAFVCIPYDYSTKSYSKFRRIIHKDLFLNKDRYGRRWKNPNWYGSDQKSLKRIGVCFNCSFDQIHDIGHPIRGIAIFSQLIFVLKNLFSTYLICNLMLSF